jgi:hypothetical protein
MNLYLNETAARKKFKGLLGNANHFLITILVGLDAIENHLITECPPDLRASWNPKDQKASANRARIMVLEMTLVRATDALDAYLTYARREPNIIPIDALTKSLDESGRSIFAKFQAVCKNYTFLDNKINALIEVMITWRNRAVHSLSDNEVSKESWKILEENKEWLEETFQGMKFDRLLSDFNKGGPPTFKETASFVRATHQLIEQLDQHHLKELNPEKFLKSLVAKNLTPSAPKAIQSLWGRDERDKLKRVVGYLKNLGLSEEKAFPHSALFSEQLILKISNFTPKEAASFFNDDLFSG